MVWCRVLWFWLVVGAGSVQAQMLPALQALPVQWQSIESWRWQGRLLQSQRFSSTSHVSELIRLVPQLLQQELTALSLSSARVLSFFDQGRHFVLLLSVQPQGVSGWLSSLDLQESTEVVLAPVFQGLYEHAWSMQEQEERPVYVVLRPKSKMTQGWAELRTRLVVQGWQEQAELCGVGIPCQWQKSQERLVFWQDLKQGLWHVLWWPS